MKKGIPQVVGLDVDDVLFPCMGPALEEAKKFGLNIRYEDVTEWNFTNFSRKIQDILFEILSSPQFYQRQCPYDGAQNMVNELLDSEHQVVFISAPFPKMMGLCAERLLKFFPRVPEKNIMLGARKDLVRTDISLDDAPHNILSSQATYPVINRRPWNKSLANVLSVNNYKEFITLVEKISLAPSSFKSAVGVTGNPGIVCLVGPSASGKTYIAEALARNPLFSAVRSTTSRAMRPGESAADYDFVSRSEFIRRVEAGDFIEHAEYSGHLYGISKSEITRIWAEGKIAVKPIEIVGAETIKKMYGDRAVTVFVRRSREAVLSALLARNVPDNDKVSRILSLDSEYANESLCDWTVSNNGSLDSAVEQIIRIVR